MNTDGLAIKISRSTPKDGNGHERGPAGRRTPFWFYLPLRRAAPSLEPVATPMVQLRPDG
jgi:hypothetical protein